MMLLMYQHGLRVSELTALTLSDVDLSERTINVRRLKNSISGRHPFYTGEGRAIRDWLATREAMDPDTGACYSMINRGVDIRTVQTHLGHARIDNTVRYTALNHARLRNLF
jgi:type 1 fimbriae regulatory protein FimB